MAWGSISLFAGFLEKENSLETLIVIFENVSPKGFFWLNMKDFEISVLTANSRYLQTAALKGQGGVREASTHPLPTGAKYIYIQQPGRPFSTTGLHLFKLV